MSVPESIRRVARPKNTVVVDTGRDSVKRYAVRARSEVIYVPDGNPQPRNGKVVGHIVDGRFVPKASRAEDRLDMLSYGASALVRSVTGDLYDDLLKVYDCREAATIMAMASLKVLRPEIPCSRMSTHYDRTFVRMFYPGAPLSKNSIEDLLQRLGRDGPKREKFCRLRMERVSKEHHVAIDGMLKKDTSTVNDLSAYSYKARLKGCRDISILYAYDIDLMEPICAEVFPGNQIDGSSYADFIRDNHLMRGIIINDKGFPPSRIEKELRERPDLHFLTPIKRNDRRIAANGMLRFEGVLEGIGGKVLFKKCRIRTGRFLYSFKSEEKAVAEQSVFFGRALRKGVSPGDLEKKQPLFGVVVFESDLDLAPDVIYRAYAERWALELVFKRYKNDECLDQTGVQGDFSVIGAEFVNFIATTATCRILAKADKAGLLKHLSLSALLDDLSSAWRRTDAPLAERPRRNDGYWVHTLVKVSDEMEALGLIEPDTKKPAVSKRKALASGSKKPAAPKKKASAPGSKKPAASKKKAPASSSKKSAAQGASTKVEASSPNPVRPA